MRLDNIDQIDAIAERANFSIFELPSSYNLANILTKHPHLQPDEGGGGTRSSWSGDLVPAGHGRDGDLPKP